MQGFCVQATEGDDYADLHILGMKMCNNQWFWQTANEKCHVAHAFRATVPGQIWTLFKSTGVGHGAQR